MLPTTIHEAPALESFTSLADHQSQTPSTFYNSKPVLHYHTVKADAIVSQEHVSKLPVFKAQEAETEEGTAGGGTATGAMDIFVTSEYAPR